MSQAEQQPFIHASTPQHVLTATLVPATAVRVRGGGYKVAVQGLFVGNAVTKSTAIAMLCQNAMTHRRGVVATFVEGTARSFMSISAGGEVSRAAAPAPGTTIPTYEDEGPRDLGQSSRSADSMREWVEERFLTPTETAPKKRRFFRRNG